LVAELQEKLQEEKLKFLEQLEEQEKRKNEEMQNIRTSLTAEQQVKLIPFYYSYSHDNYVLFCCFQVMECGVSFFGYVTHHLHSKFALLCGARV